MFVDASASAIPVAKLKPAQVQALLQDPEQFLVDVRPQDFERNASFIRDQHHCPLVYLAERYQDLPRGKGIVITDWAMKQSPMAAKFLISKGYRVTGVLQGGMERWVAERLPVEERIPGSDNTATDASRPN